jgi:hypothetical protein
MRETTEDAWKTRGTMRKFISFASTRARARDGGLTTRDDARSKTDLSTHRAAPQHRLRSLLKRR